MPHNYLTHHAIRHHITHLGRLEVADDGDLPALHLLQGHVLDQATDHLRSPIKPQRLSVSVREEAGFQKAAKACRVKRSVSGSSLCTLAMPSVEL